MEFPLLCQSGSSELPVGKVLAAEAVIQRRGAGKPLRGWRGQRPQWGVPTVCNGCLHPHLYALVADGLFARSGVFHVMPETGLKPLEELFLARVIRFLVDKGLLPPERARMLRGWLTRASTSTADAGCSPASARTWNGSPNTSSATPFRSKRCERASRAPASASGSILYRFA